MIRSSALVALTLGCTSPAVVGCGGGDDDDVAPADDGGDGDIDSGSEVGFDSGHDTGDVGSDTKPDTTITDGGTDTAKTDTGDAGTDTHADTPDTAVADSGVDTTVADVGIDTTVDDTFDSGVDTTPVTCGTAGTACAGGKICEASGLCGNCTTDTECAAATAGTLCFAGTCAVATCHPSKDATCSGTDAVNCCSNSSSAGACVSAGAGKLTCCADADCAGATGTTTCDTASNTCVCPAPAVGQLFVATTGSDVTGNGSSSCPFATVTQAVATLTATPPTGAASITLKKLAAGGPAVYAEAAQVLIPATITAGIVIKGDGTADDVRVTAPSSAPWVFNSKAAGTGFQNLTVTSTSTTGGGIFVDATAATTEASISSVKVTFTATSTSDALRVRGGASPTIGPAFVSTGGANGIRVTEGTASATTASHPTIVSAAGAQTIISGTTGSCIKADGVGSALAPFFSASSTDAATPIHLSNCGTNGIQLDVATVSDPGATGYTAEITNVTIDRSGIAAAGFLGVRVSNAASLYMANSTISGVGGNGIQVEGAGFLQIAGATVSSGNARGLFVTANARAILDGFTARSNIADGLYCDAASPVAGAEIKLRNSSFLLNSGNGASFNGACVGDIGTSASPGNNTYNRSGSKNTGTGICYLSTSSLGGIDATPTASFWACSGGGGVPTQGAGGACTPGADYGSTPGAKFSMVAGQTCL